MKRAFALAAASAVIIVPLVTAPASAGAPDDATLVHQDATASLSDSRAGVRSGTALSGSIDADGHKLTWALTGAGAAPPALAESYDGVVSPGAQISFTGSMAFTIGQGYVTNLSQSASLSGASGGASFSDRVGGGTFTTPFSLTATAYKPAAGSTPEPGSVIGYVSASASSRNCNDWGVCGGPSVSLSLAVVAGGNVDTEPPTVTIPEYTKLVTLADQRARFRGTTTYPIKIPMFAEDNSGKVKLHAELFSDGAVVGGADMDTLGRAGRYVYFIKRPPQGKGPYFLCAWAEDAAGNRSANAPRSACTWLSLQVPASSWSNGCGSDGVAEGWWGQVALWVQNFIGDDRVYGGDSTVSVRNACNVHDGAYAGVTLYDGILKRPIDFRTWSRAQVDQLFYEDIQRRCLKDLLTPAEKAWRPTCMGGLTLPAAEEFFFTTSQELGMDGEPQGLVFAWVRLQDRVGAQLYLDLVRKHGAVGFDTDATVAGTQNTVPGQTSPAGGARNPA